MSPEVIHPELRARLLSIARRKIVDHPFIVQPDAEGLIPAARLFSGTGQRILELGAGSGELCLDWMKKHPEDSYVAFEIKWDRIRRILRLLERNNVQNVRIVPVNFSWFLESMLPGKSFDAIIAYFPDPWPKRRHWKHRLVQPDFPEQVIALLRRGGQVHLATDYAPYARKMLRVFRRSDFDSQMPAPGFIRSNPFQVRTRFEELTSERKPHFMAWTWRGE
ncbi:MAG: methyltransferase [Leptospirales bacterium]|nr:methyltransferase [Leptospirales bacterium]